MTKIRKNTNTIEIVSGGGCSRVFGIPFFLIGFIIFADIFTEHGLQFHNDSFDEAIQGFFSCIFMAVGIGLIFGSVRIAIDRNTQSIKQYIQLFFRKNIYVTPFTEISALTLKQEDEDGFVLLLKGKDRKLTLFKSSDSLIIYQLACDSAIYTGIKLDNQIGNITQQYNSAELSGDRYLTKPSFKGGGNLLLAILMTSVFFYISTFSDNWSWSRLNDLNNNIVYVEFPEELFIYDQPGKYDLGLSFYQYKSSLFGNEQKQYLQLEPKQYQLSVQALDGFAKQAVSIVDQQLMIKTAGSYRINLTVNSGIDSPYIISESSKKNTQAIVLEQRKNTNAWEAVSIDRVPVSLQRRAKILIEHFAGMKSVSLVDHQGDYYFNASSTYHTRGSPGPRFYSQSYKMLLGTTEKLPWTALPMPIVKNFLHSHQGMIYSFGGYHFDSHKKTGNWLYLPEQDQWNQLSATPLLQVDSNEQLADVVAVYSLNDELFVMVHTQDYALYQFDFTAEQQWQLIKQFSLPKNNLNWQYFDDKTLYSYKTKVSRNQSEQKEYKGYIQLLDLDSYQVKILSITPKINYKQSKSLLSPERSDLLVFSDKQKFYGYYEGQFYLKSDI